MKTSLRVFAAAACLGLGVPAMAQGLAAPARPTTTPATIAPAQLNMSMDRNVAQCLIIDNENEIAIARLAEKNSENKEVKAFAQMMIKDHNEFLAQLQKFAQAAAATATTTTTTDATRTDPARIDPRTGNKVDPTTGRTDTTGSVVPGDKTPGPPDNSGRGTNEPASDASRGNAARTDTSTRVTVVTGDAMGDKFLQIRKEIGQRCLASATKELDSKRGAELDKCYVGMQIAAHQKMVDELGVLKSHVSANLAQVLGQGESTATMHLDHAKKLMKQLDH